MTSKEFEGFSWSKLVARQGKNLTMDKKLFITVCPTGALFSRRQNPNQPYTQEEISREVIEAYGEGASLAHIHTRDEHGGPATTTELLTATIDPILDSCPDIIIQPSAAEGYNPEAGQYTYETMRPMVEALHGVNPRYMESTIFTPVSYYLDGMVTLASEDNMVRTISYLQENSIKPEFMAHNWEGILNVKEWLIRPGILERPPFISMGPGMHNAAETYPDPWGMLYLMGMTRMMPEDAVVGASVGGRNWLPLSTLAILLGVDFVRVGMEDHLWMYPHRDEKISSCGEAARKIATIARELGREVGSAKEARRLLGMK